MSYATCRFHPSLLEACLVSSCVLASVTIVRRLKAAAAGHRQAVAAIEERRSKSREGNVTRTLSCQEAEQDSEFRFEGAWVSTVYYRY